MVNGSLGQIGFPDNILQGGFLMEMQNIFSEVVPEFMEPILRQGIADGSIHTDHPKEMAGKVMVNGSLGQIGFPDNILQGGFLIALLDEQALCGVDARASRTAPSTRTTPRKWRRL